MVVAESPRRGAGRDRPDRGGLRPAPGRRWTRRRWRSPARRSCTTRSPTTSPSPGWWPAATRSRRSRDAEVTVQAAHRAAAAAAHRDGSRARRWPATTRAPASSRSGPPARTRTSTASSARSCSSCPSIGSGSSRPRWAAASAARSRRIADEALVSFASMQLGRPVKWTEDRLGELQGHHPRPRPHPARRDVRHARTARITGLRTKVYAGLGAYASTAGPGIPTILHGLVYSGAVPDPEHPRHHLRRLHHQRRRWTRTAAPAGPRRPT